MDVDVMEEVINDLLKTSDGASNATLTFDEGDCVELLAALDGVF